MLYSWQVAPKDRILGGERKGEGKKALKHFTALAAQNMLKRLAAAASSGLGGGCQRMQILWPRPEERNQKLTKSILVIPVHSQV